MVLCRRRGGCPPLQRNKTRNLCNVNLVWAVPGFCVAGGEACPTPLATQNNRFASGCWGGAHSRHVCCLTQQTCLLRHTADVSAVSHGRHVCCVTQPTCLLSHTSNSRHVYCAAQQTMLAVWRSRHCLGPNGAFWTRHQIRNCHIYMYMYYI